MAAFLSHQKFLCAIGCAENTTSQCSENKLQWSAESQMRYLYHLFLPLLHMPLGLGTIVGKEAEIV